METKYLVIGGVVLGVVGVVYYLNKSGAYASTPGTNQFATQQQAQLAAQQAAMAQMRAQAQAAQQPAPPMAASPAFQQAAFPQGENLPQSFPPMNLSPQTSSPSTPGTSSATQMKAPPPNLAATRMALKQPPAMPQAVAPRPAGPGIPPSPFFPGGLSFSGDLPWRMRSAHMPGPNLNRRT